jgi:hypothetical protein
MLPGFQFSGNGPADYVTNHNNTPMPQTGYNWGNMFKGLGNFLGLNAQADAKTGNIIGAPAGNLLNIGKGIFDVWSGWQQMGMAKDAMKMQKTAYNNDLDRWNKLYQKDLYDRANARYQANPNAYQSPEQVKQQYSLDFKRA